VRAFTDFLTFQTAPTLTLPQRGRGRDFF
jgi:hypothetical protein